MVFCAELQFLFLLLCFRSLEHTLCTHLVNVYECTIKLIICLFASPKNVYSVAKVLFFR